MRVTIERTIWSKIQTQLGKDKNKELKEKVATLKVTYSPFQDAILWDAPLPILKDIKDLLINEKTFMRKPESAAYVLIGKVIERLERLTADQPE